MTPDRKAPGIQTPLTSDGNRATWTKRKDSAMSERALRIMEIRSGGWCDGISHKGPTTFIYSGDSLVAVAFTDNDDPFPHLIEHAFNSYVRAFGAKALEAAEGDALGEALAILRRLAADRVVRSAMIDEQVVDVDAVLAKAARAHFDAVAKKESEG